MGEFLLAAALGIGIWDALSSSGQQLTVTNNIMTSLMVNSTTTVSTECYQSIDTSQLISVSGGAGTYDLTKACTKCQDTLNALQANRTALELEAIQRNKFYVPQTGNPQIFDSTVSVGTTPTQPESPPGICDLMCFGVVVKGIAQEITVTQSTDCKVNTDIRTDVDQQLNESISQYLKNQQDIFGTVLGGLSSSSDSIVNSLSSTLAQNVTHEFTDNLRLITSHVQDITIENAHSIYVSNLKQTFSASQMGTLTITDTVLDQLRQSAEYSIGQGLLNKNDTVGSIATQFLGLVNTLSDMIDNSVSLGLVIAGLVLAIMAVAILAVMLFNKKARNWLHQQYEEKLQEQQISQLQDREIAKYQNTKKK